MATLFPRVDFDSINQRTDYFHRLRACGLISQHPLQFRDLSAVEIRKIGMDGELHVPLLDFQFSSDLALRTSERRNWSRTEPGSPSPPVMKSRQRLMPRSTCSRSFKRRRLGP